MTFKPDDDDETVDATYDELEDHGDEKYDEPLDDDE